MTAPIATVGAVGAVEVVEKTQVHAPYKEMTRQRLLYKAQWRSGAVKRGWRPQDYANDSLAQLAQCCVQTGTQRGES